MSFKFQVCDSPVGPLYLVEKEGKLRAVLYEASWPKVKERLSPIEESATPLLEETRKQLGEYFRGERRAFDLPFELEGTDFQKKTWSALLEIPFGETKTYKEQALAINAPNASRAVGRTNGLNLLSIVLPCHRVIGSNGALTGYAGGLEAKRFLFDLEKKISNS